MIRHFTLGVVLLAAIRIYGRRTYTSLPTRTVFTRTLRSRRLRRMRTSNCKVCDTSAVFLSLTTGGSKTR